jgi:Flp pilus assembly protein TadD
MLRVCLILFACALSACTMKNSAEVTGSLPSASTPSTSNEAAWRAFAEEARQQFEANPNDKQAALNYARALRTLDQKPQAVAVLQQVTIRNPKDMDLLAAYGKALSDVGRFEEAQQVLSRAHVPEDPNWRVLSAQGTVADQMGDPVRAQRFYEAALKIAPNEPSVLSNLGLSYALTNRLRDAETTLREAIRQPDADARVRQNLALVLGMQGKFADAESIFQKDMPADRAKENTLALRRLVAQKNGWGALREIENKGTAPSETPKRAGKTRGAAIKPTPPLEANPASAADL